MNTHTNIFPTSKVLENQTLKEIIQIQKDNYYNIIRFKNSNSYTTFYENPADCGCLLVCNMFDITKEVQDYIELFMNENGYSKIIGTIAIYNTKNYLLNTIKQLGYTCIETGESARHPKTECITYLVYKIITPTTTDYVN